MASPPPPPLPDDFSGSAIDYVSSSPPLPQSPVSSSHSSSLKNLSPSILIILTILAFTAFASVILCLVLRYLNRRCLLRLSAVSGSSSSSSVSSRRIIPAEQTAVRCTNSFSPIESLPLFSFSSVTRRSSTAAADCAVCLSKFEAEDQLRLLPLCCHAFHAQCVDTWLQSNQSCPLCRSAIFASESDVMKASMASYAAEGRGGGDSFRLEIGSISRRQAPSDSGEGRRSYSIGSFEYFVEEDSEVNFTNAHRRSVSDKEDIEAPISAVSTERSLAADVGSGRNWLKDYVDRLSNSVSSRALSFRGSGRFFTGSSRRSEVTVAGEWEQENSRVGEEISELFRWFSGV
ncbi:E3 ubiquitin-protein ligase ATL4 [Cucumis melo var. makuwa]|uniref:RING-type E3 ubiquitin transferase n=2 Tax=Cucumis melo TaxID=3656 RepID=A0A5D3D0U7_CUCMM|nr:E3 ubiquitin-protein ligase ATL4 [Cucumis melo]KAA0049111.1 E3 ubiquitin-protein ligase ATL4 [Cucumis melo var. makuwa]TYK17452.1 E3 ubiquitin-protein ligase ATL4 [Cucumis melo var. makuwa]